MNISSILFVSVGLFVGFAHAIDFKDCGSKHGKVSSVDVSNCKATPCVFKKGTNVNVTVKFTANEDSNVATAVIHGIIGGVPLPFPFDESDACKYGGLKCPLKSGTDYVYSLNMPIKPEYPSVSLTAKWELQDSNSEDLFCIEAEAKIE